MVLPNVALAVIFIVGSFVVWGAGLWFFLHDITKKAAASDKVR